MNHVHQNDWFDNSYAGQSAHLQPGFLQWQWINLTNATLGNQNFKWESFSLNGANLTGANFSGGLGFESLDVSKASDGTQTNFTGTNFSGVDLTSATFDSNPQFSQDPTQKTDFSSAHLLYSQLPTTTVNDATVPNWSNLKLVNTQIDNLHLSELQGLVANGADLTGWDLSGATLTGASFKGVILSSATLANANLTSAHFDGAQCGAKSALFTMPTSLVPDLNAGGPTVPSTVVTEFSENDITLSSEASLTVRIPSQDWLISDDDNLYEIVASSSSLSVLVYLPHDQAAIFSSAYMPNAIFTSANLYAVNFAGAQWYGTQAAAPNADLEEADFSNANLGNIALTEARLYGASFDGAILVSANLAGAFLQPSASKKEASLVSASLQGTLFTQGHLDSADLTNAAVALNDANQALLGVPLFSLNPSNPDPGDPNFITDLNAGNLSTDLSNAFTDNGYALLSGSTITVVTLNSQWTISNTEPNPTNLGSVYETFTIVTDGTLLMVYGSSLWITQIGSNNQLETLPYSFAATDLKSSYMTGDTTCPNGDQLSNYPANGLTWEQMMTADSPPTPPACVPSGNKWCP